MSDLKAVEEAIEAEVQKRVACYLVELAHSIRGSASAHKAWSKRAVSSPKDEAAGEKRKCPHCGKNLRSDNRKGVCSTCAASGKTAPESAAASNVA
jgi:uncharacterized paraquat-inducible protein A